MARPRKAGLSYFPLDVDIFDADYKIVDLLERFGPKGFAVYIAVLCMVYREGYCLEIPMRSLQAQLGKMIGNRWLTDKALILDVISFCGELGLFDAGLLRQGVITSAGIQRRYREATKRSKTRIEKYRLLEAETPEAGESAAEKNVSATKNGVSAAETPISAAETPQRKVKERKENQSKENKRKENSLPPGREEETPPQFCGGSPPPPEEREGAPSVYQLYGRFRNVRLTPDEYRALAAETVDADALIDKLSAHMAATGRQYRNHFARLLQWDMEDRAKGKGKPKNGPKNGPNNGPNNGFGGPSFDLEAFQNQGFDLPDLPSPPDYDIRGSEQAGFGLPDLPELPRV